MNRRERTKASLFLALVTLAASVPLGAENERTIRPASPLEDQPSPDAIRVFFDERDRLIRAEYPDGSQLRYEFDQRGNLAQITDSRLGTTAYSHNQLDQLTSVTYPNERRFSFGYDEAGRLKSIVYPDGERVSIDYDPQRLAVTVRDSSTLMEQVFHTSGKLVQLRLEPGLKSSFDYDAAGKLTAIRDGHGIILNDFETRIGYLDGGRVRIAESPLGTQIIRLDDRGQLAKVEMGPGIKIFYDRAPGGGFFVTSLVGFTRLDQSGHVVAAMTVDGLKFTFEWTAQGRLWRSSSLFSGTTEYKWAPAADRVTVMSPKALMQDLHLDSSGRLETIDLLGRQFKIGYDPMGNPNRVTGPVGQTFAELKYHYDDRGRLERVIVPDWNRFNKMTDALIQLNGKNPSLSADWMKRYDAEWFQGYSASRLQNFDQLVSDIERFPEEFMRVQASVWGLTFLTMVARPTSMVLDWVNKPLAMLLGHSIAKGGIDEFWDFFVSNLDQIPNAAGVAAGFRRVDESLKNIEEASKWGSFAKNITKVVLSSAEVHPGWWFGNPLTVEPLRQMTWIHDTFETRVNLGKLAEGVAAELSKKAFGMYVGHLTREEVGRILSASPDSKTRPEYRLTKEIHRSVGASGNTQQWPLSGSAPNDLSSDASKAKYYFPGHFGLLPLPTKDYEMALQEQHQIRAMHPGGINLGGPQKYKINPRLAEEIEKLEREAIEAQKASQDAIRRK